jgi:hypothetical protein
MTLSDIYKQRLYEAMDSYNERFDFLLSQINSQEGKYRFPSQPYAIIGDYLSILSFIEDEDTNKKHYCNEFENIINKLTEYKNNNLIYETLLQNDLLFLVNELDRLITITKEEINSVDIELSEALLTLEDHVIDDRDEFEYIKIGLEYTHHFKINEKALTVLESFDENLQNLLTKLKDDFNYSVSRHFVVTNKITKRFWWRFID